MTPILLRLRRFAGGVAVPVVFPPDLYAAIVEAFDAGSLPGQIAGGLATTAVSDAAPMPVVHLAERGTSDEMRTASRVAARLTLAARAYAGDQDIAATKGDLFDQWFVGRRFDFQGGQTTRVLRNGEPRHGRDPNRGRRGETIFYQERLYSLRVIRVNGS